jgi:ABC-type transport system involved in cytochrome c biogenesis ATPase subunit
MFERLQIENFTAFRRAEFEFVPGINVLVGGNATGKTHVMKLLYSIQKTTFEWKHAGRKGVDAKEHPERRRPDIGEVLFSVFQPETIGDLIRRQQVPSFPRVTMVWNTHGFQFELEQTQVNFDPPEPVWVFPYQYDGWHDITRPVFIPVKDMLAHSVGFISLYDQRDIDFDATQRDVLSLAFTPRLRQSALSAENARLLKIIAAKIEGRVEVRGQRFYIVGPSGAIEMHLAAEGWRKLALLYQLIANGFLCPGNVLYWDEPETNLNPSMMDEVVAILMELARQGVQIFLATHDYILLKELDLQRHETDEIRHFALERKEDGAVNVRPAASYMELNPNLIAAQYERLYDMEIERALGGANAS